MTLNAAFGRFAAAVSHGSGQPIAFIAALVIIALWGLTGPLFGFSETWQLVVNTATTIVTFLMVFVLQNTQNRDSEALHAKLDELILVGRAENRFIEIERLSEDDIQRLRAAIERAAARAERGRNAQAADAPTSARGGARARHGRPADPAAGR